jgi:CubicO group peptidase (beta-lactamase class C family)
VIKNDADGMVTPIDLGARRFSGCAVVMQIRHQDYRRAVRWARGRRRRARVAPALAVGIPLLMGLVPTAFFALHFTALDLGAPSPGTASASARAAVAAVPPGPFSKVDASLGRRVRDDGLSGAATVVVGPDGAVLHEYHVGAMRSSTRLPIASASKWLTAAMVMVLVDRGRLSLDDRVATYLPAFVGDKAAMTVRQLLSHRSGLTTAECVGDPAGTLAGCVRDLARHAVLAAEPGREFHYSNDGYHVAGRIVEVLTGSSFERAFEALIGRPVGMTHTSFDRFGGSRTRNPTPAASAISTVDDYRRFLAMVSNQGKVRARQVLSPGSVAEIMRDQVRGVDTGDDPAVGITRIPTYGLGVWRDVTDSADQAQIVSGNGALGFYPWLDLAHHTYGIVAVDDRRGPERAVPESQRIARREWSTAARLAGRAG